MVTRLSAHALNMTAWRRTRCGFASVQTSGTGSIIFHAFYCACPQTLWPLSATVYGFITLSAWVLNWICQCAYTKHTHKHTFDHCRRSHVWPYAAAAVLESGVLSSVARILSGFLGSRTFDAVTYGWSTVLCGYIFSVSVFIHGNYMGLLFFCYVHNAVALTTTQTKKRTVDNQMDEMLLDNVTMLSKHH